MSHFLLVISKYRQNLIGFKIINGFYDIHNLGRIGNCPYNFAHRLVRMWDLVQRWSTYRSRENISHRFRIVIHRYQFLCLWTAHQPSSAMRGRIIPILITFSPANKRTIPQILYFKYFLILSRAFTPLLKRFETLHFTSESLV